MSADTYLTRSQAGSLLDTLPGNFLAFTAERQVIFASVGYARVMGVEKEQLEGSLLMENLPKGLEAYGVLLQEIAEEVMITREEVGRPVSGTRQAGPVGQGVAYCWRVSCKPFSLVKEQAYLVHVVEEAPDQVPGDMDRYCLLQEAGHLILWDWDRKEQLTWRSEGFFSMLGISKADTHASNPRLWESLLHPDEAGEVLRSIRGAFNSGARDWQAEYRLRHACGSYLVVADRARILYDSQGQVVRMVGTTIDVTERREKELEASKLHQLLDSLPGIVWTSDAGRNITFVNQAFQDLTGMSLQQAQQGEAHDLVHPDDRDRLISIKDGNEVAFRLKIRDGSYRWYTGRSVPITDMESRVVSRIGVSTDVHELNKERTALQASGEKLREMLDALPIMAWAARPDGTYTYYNRRWWDFFLTSDEGWSLEQWGELMHPQDRERTVGLWAESLATGAPYSMKLRWRAHKAATYRWFQAYAAPVRDAAGNVGYWMGATVDMQEQEEAQALLEEEKTAFQFLSDVVPHMVWRTDAKGFHNYFNQRWVEYTGYDVESSLGTEMWNNLLHPEDQERARRVWTHSLETGAPYEIEYRFRRASDGEWRWFLARALPLRNEAGEIMQWYGTCTDIEEKKHTERLLESQKQALELINQDLDRFVHMIGHDLKLPLVNMGALFEALAETGSFDTPDSEQLVRHFRRSHKNMTTTLSDLMELARLQRSALGSATVVSLSDVLEEVLESLGNLVSSSHAEVSVQLAKPDRFLYFKSNLRSVLHNLLSNALKYRHPDRRPSIEVRSSWEEGFLRLTVSDNGLGMDLERDGHKLFGAFNRLHSHTEGSGLGLYIVKRIVEVSGGQVSVSSEKSKGTVFTIMLKPLA